MASPFSAKANDQDIEAEVLADFGLSLGPVSCSICSVRFVGQQARKVTLERGPVLLKPRGTILWQNAAGKDRNTQRKSNSHIATD